MRTKTLLLTAALSAAGLATSLAQVYSVNAVGYVNHSVPGNFKVAMLANPLNGTNNNLNTLIPLDMSSDSQDGTTVFRFDVPTQNYYNAITWIGGFGWFPSSGIDADLIINPGEGFWVQNPKTATLNITFVGEVPSGTLNNPIAGAPKVQMAASVVPKGARLGTPATAGTLGFPAGHGDTVFLFDTATQNYRDAFTYINDPADPDPLKFIGWFSPSEPDAIPDGPIIAPGTGFWVQKAGAGATWTETFSVN